MLDIKFIRENKDLIKDGARKKHVDFNVDELLNVDDNRKELLVEVEDMRARQNEATAEIARSSDANDREKLISEMQSLKVKLQEKEEKLNTIMTNWQALMLQVPNIPDMSVPEGVSDEENKEIKKWGETSEFSFEAKDHMEIMKALDIADFERGSKVHGFRGYYLKGDGALLSWAIWNYAQEFFLKKGFSPMIVPAIVKKMNLYGTGHLPNEAEDLYETQDGDYLSGTAEVATMGYFSDDIIDFSKGDKKILSFSPCYRREAGSYGKDTKGLIRVHEFYKLEQVILCPADHQKSVEYHEWLNRNTEEFIESLKIPYRTVVNCGGDLGLGQVKKYDIELWVPGEKKYREISSASYFHDFQTRRFNIKYRNEKGKNVYAHSLNCTAIPTPRILVSLVENFQKEDGAIEVPEVLRKYVGKDQIT